MGRNNETDTHSKQWLHPGEGICVLRSMVDCSVQNYCTVKVCSIRRLVHKYIFNTHTQNIDEIPTDLKTLYKTVWEISQRTLIDMAADRGAYIDQSQSFNVHMAEANFGKLTSMHFYSWKKVGDSPCVPSLLSVPIHCSLQYI